MYSTRSTSRTTFCLVLVATLSPVTTWADTNASPAPSVVPVIATSAVIPDFSGAQATYKAALDLYASSKQNGTDFKNLIQSFNAFQKAYKDQVKAINQAFKDAANSARETFQSGIPGAKTAAAKAKLRATRDSALVAATLARDNAVAALGAVPVRPVKEVKATK